MLATLYRVSMLGVHLVDAAEVYAWGLTREFDTVGAAWSTRLVARIGPADERAAVQVNRVRKVAGNDG